ncbi:probable carboxylesterase 2 [Diospyros lotus]|uniref:probable carboxylesterase 2 n=1 Tax=Diospyros lotus TaxID=55363 RepID=UPI002258E713|nr:probable carboxylesterase 2 [Diospyros lotus]
MDSGKGEVAQEVLPYLRVYKDGTVERLAGIEVAPAGLDPETGVFSKDMVIIPETGVSARLYRPSLAPNNRKLPLVVYFHGGAFCISSVADPFYHNSLKRLVSEANVILVSVGYRLAPENPLPAAYDDSWAALQWVATHSGGDGTEPWIKNDVDFGKVFLAGDSAGANMAHHFAIRQAGAARIKDLDIHGILMIHPYFWGKKQLGSEEKDQARKAMVDCWWKFVCPSEKGNDDPLINPFVEGSPSLSGLACGRVIVCVAEKDILRERGKLYYESLVKSGWKGAAEMAETEGEDHVFHIFNPLSEKAVKMIKRLASFINKEQGH